MKKDIPCKKCGKLVNHVSRYCLEHRRPWREGYKMGFQIRESVLDVPEEELILELEKEASCPHIMAIGRTPLLVRSANMLRKQAKYIAELEKTLEQIREGCQNVKEDVGGNNEQIRALATLVIRDCNLTLKKAQEK